MACRPASSSWGDPQSLGHRTRSLTASPADRERGGACYCMYMYVCVYTVHTHIYNVIYTCTLCMKHTCVCISLVRSISKSMTEQLGTGTNKLI